MQSIYIDESGNGGLQDAKQPVFALASVAIDEHQAKLLREEYLPSDLVRSRELKHMDLCKRKTARVKEGLRSLQQAIVTRFPTRVYIIEKRFFLIEKMLMDCISARDEKLLAIQQIALDIYRDYDRISSVCNMQGLLESFVAADKRRANDERFGPAFDSFVGNLKLAVRCSDVLEHAFGEFVAGDRDCREEFLVSCGSVNLHQTLMFGLLNELLDAVDDNVMLVFDESPQFDDIKRGFAIPFFRKVRSVESGVSDECFGLQIADLIAGGGRLVGEKKWNYCGEKDMLKEYRNYLENLYSKSNIMLYQPPERAVSISNRILELASKQAR